MADTRRSGCGDLRTQCFIIGYMNLVAAVVDIVIHVLITAIVSDGFECDINLNSLRAVEWPWLEPLLLLLNLGTHGFFPFPMTLTANNFHEVYMSIPSVPVCYPGMLHIYLVDVLNFLINVIWLKFVLSFISAIYRRDPESMKMFFYLSAVKGVLQQVVYIMCQPSYQASFSVETYWFLKLVDIGLAILFLYIINNYINVLYEGQRAAATVEEPPSYNESLNESSKAQEATGINVTDGVKKDQKIAFITDCPTYDVYVKTEELNTQSIIRG
ncbi:uncharacterized protein LOC126380370 [Pectinophora gossypiella]|uniref:uncharacterized protein LOC126380370 n=1 Tax=Pectinophora gossypiella TaxID=13191 RepID=UPI00214EE528|nr:uncharacterized protein LOC126380370 [Pectinophora gossypiella]